MDNQRLILFFALMLVLFLVWDAWQKDYVQPVAQPAATAPAASAPTRPGDVPTAATAPTATGQVPQAGAALGQGERIRVVTDQFDAVIDTVGGDLRQADLLTYPVKVETPDQPFRLLRDTPPNLFVVQSGLLADGAAPDHYARYTVAQTDYRLVPGQDELRVPLTWVGENGVRVTKTYVFKRGSHRIGLEFKVENGGATAWTGRQYRQLQRSRPDSASQSFFIVTYTGGVVYDATEKYQKIEFDDMAEKDLARDISGGWAAMIQHYFLAALLPGEKESNHYYSKSLGQDRFVLGMISMPQTVQPGQSASFSTQLYVGPKVQSELATLATDLDLTVDYGMLTFIAKPLFWALEWFHKWIGNWGWAIVLVTLVIKLVFYPLSAASYRSMANMRKLQPKLVALRERYGDDRQRMGQAMMELYKKEKINPLGGCLPMIVQIPVFIALYWVLLESVELRQAPFILWINDLAVRDPYYVLPLLMGVSMFVQQKLNPPPPDPIQAKVLMWLPVVFTLFFAFFPAGLVLYWLANSVLSLAQQWWITHKIEKTAEAA